MSVVVCVDGAALLKPSALPVDKTIMRHVLITVVVLSVTCSCVSNTANERAEQPTPSSTLTPPAEPDEEPRRTPEMPTTCAPHEYLDNSRTCVPRPNDDPVNATARCNDGTYSHSNEPQGQCSFHGGVDVSIDCGEGSNLDISWECDVQSFWEHKQSSNQ